MQDHDRTIRNEERLDGVEGAIRDLRTRVNGLYLGIFSILGAVVVGFFVGSPGWMELLIFLVVGLGILVFLCLGLSIKRRVFRRR